jgi:hypothetical protein
MKLRPLAQGKYDDNPRLAVSKVGYFVATTTHKTGSTGGAIYSYSLKRFLRGEKEGKVVRKGKDDCEGVACLRDGTLVVHESHAGPQLVSPEGKTLRPIDSPEYCGDWIGVAGSPERLFLTSTEDDFLAVLDTSTWEATLVRTKGAAGPTIVSECGITRGGVAKPLWKVIEWPWRGTKMQETNVLKPQYFDLSARVAAGYVFSDRDSEVVVIAPAGTPLWKKPWYGPVVACGGNRLLLLGGRHKDAVGEAIMVDAATGRELAAVGLRAVVYDPHAVVYDPHDDCVLVASEHGIDIINDLPELAPSTFTPSMYKNAKDAKAEKDKAQAKDAKTLAPLEAYAAEILGTTDLAGMRRLAKKGAKIGSFIEADVSDTGQRKLAGLLRQLTAHMKKLPQDVRLELQCILDILADS